MLLLFSILFNLFSFVILVALIANLLLIATIFSFAENGRKPLYVHKKKPIFWKQNYVKIEILELFLMLCARIHSITLNVFCYEMNIDLLHSLQFYAIADEMHS